MWRGLVLNRAVQQFLEDVHWGDLDYLLIDMPPGTGDIQMGLARMLPRTEVLVVTTPPVAAQKVAARTADMARKGYLRVAGVHREHERLHLRARHRLRPVRLGRRRPPGRRHRRAAGGPGPAPPVGGGRRRRRARRWPWTTASPWPAVFAAIADEVVDQVAPVIDMDSVQRPPASSGWRRPSEAGAPDRLTPGRHGHRQAACLVVGVVARRHPLGASFRRWAHERAPGHRVARPVHVVVDGGTSSSTVARPGGRQGGGHLGARARAGGPRCRPTTPAGSPISRAVPGGDGRRPAGSRVQRPAAGWPGRRPCRRRAGRSPPSSRA